MPVSINSMTMSPQQNTSAKMAFARARSTSASSSASTSSDAQQQQVKLETEAAMAAPVTSSLSNERQARRSAALQRRREQNRLAQARRRQRSDTLLNELQDDVHRLRKQLEARDQFIARLKASNGGGMHAARKEEDSTQDMLAQQQYLADSLTRSRSSTNSSSAASATSSSSSTSGRLHGRSSSISSDASSLDSILDSHAALQAQAFAHVHPMGIAMPIDDVSAASATAFNVYPQAQYHSNMVVTPMQQHQQLLSPPDSPSLLYSPSDMCMPASTTAWVTAQQAVLGAWDHANAQQQHHNDLAAAAVTAAAAAASCFVPMHDTPSSAASSFYAASDAASAPVCTPTPSTPAMRPAQHQRAVSDSILVAATRSQQARAAAVADANASPRTWQALLEQLTGTTPFAAQQQNTTEQLAWDSTMPSVLRPVMH